jgi:hypothetical protein
MSGRAVVALTEAFVMPREVNGWDSRLLLTLRSFAYPCRIVSG